jgi:hypothetical protein
MKAKQTVFAGIAVLLTAAMCSQAALRVMPLAG